MDNTVYEINYDNDPPKIPRLKKRSTLQKQKNIIITLIVAAICVNISLIFYIATSPRKNESKNARLASRVTRAPTHSTENPNASPITTSDPDISTDQEVTTSGTLENLSDDKESTSEAVPQLQSDNESAVLASPTPQRAISANTFFSGQVVNYSLTYTTLFPTQTPLFPTSYVMATTTPIPSSTPSITPSPTPFTQPNIDEIVDNKDALDGTVVEVVGYMVTGNIGQEACIYVYLCDHSVIVMNNSADFDRDLAYDTTVHMSITEKESDYISPGLLIFEALVDVQDDGSVILIKQY